MKIKNISHTFEPLQKIMRAANYSVFFHVILINFDDENELSLINFQSFFPLANAQGELIKTSFNKSKNLIEDYLSFTSTDEGKCLPGEDFPRVSNELLTKRINLFWNLVQENLNLPPRTTMEYFPEPGTLFDDFLYWKFTYIFINENKGLFINVDASD